MCLVSSSVLACLVTRCVGVSCGCVFSVLCYALCWCLVSLIVLLYCGAHCVGVSCVIHGVDVSCVMQCVGVSCAMGALLSWCL